MVAHYRLAQWWLTTTTADRTRRDRVYDTLHERYCHPSLTIILHLKGLYVKIGQVLSARPDFVPRQYVDLFSTVQDAIPQWPIEHVHEIVKQELQSEYGLDWDDVFESMDPVALGSASIGQVHRAVLKSPWEKNNGGKVVTVKVMHPGAKDRFRHDFQVFKWL
jgi:predicted unusual protein kinase regulating ubiquinone biosynthesis (AarF/ABC1/UbiB family)